MVISRSGCFGTLACLNNVRAGYGQSAFIAGRASPPDRRMGHAGAIIQGDRGSYESKRQALEGAGAIVLDTPSGIGPALKGLVP